MIFFFINLVNNFHDYSTNFQLGISLEALTLQFFIVREDNRIVPSAYQ